MTTSSAAPNSLSQANPIPPADHPAYGSKIAGGLVYVTPEMPGFSREKHGEWFRYRDKRGELVTDEQSVERFDHLAIPPAYEKVWICPLQNGHLQATGMDARGRRQYRYHPDWRAVRDADKFLRIEAFGLVLPRIRQRVDRDLASASRSGRAPTRVVVLAAIVRLLDTTYVRVGNEEYAQTNGSFGLTTLRTPHAGVRGDRLRLKFRGKSGVMQEVELDDARIARLVRRCQQLPGQELFQYEDDEGALCAVDSADVNAYLQEAALPRGRSAAADAAHFTAKDFRTWHGTVQALELTRLACAAPHGDPQRYNAKAVLVEVARQLGNTPAVCKKSYVHPAVMALGGQLAGSVGTGMADIWERIAGKRQPVRRLHAAEHRLLGFLRHHRLEAAASLRVKRTRVRPQVAAPGRKKIKALN